MTTSLPSRPEQLAAKALAARRMRRGEFDLGLMAGPAGEIGEPGQRPVDAGRGDFDLVIAFDRILGLDEIEQRVAKAWRSLPHPCCRPARSAMICSVLCCAAHQAQAHQLEARRFDDGFKDRFQMRRGGENGDTPNHKAFSPRRPCDRHTTGLVVWDGGYVRRKVLFNRPGIAPSAFAGKRCYPPPRLRAGSDAD